MKITGAEMNRALEELKRRIGDKRFNEMTPKEKKKTVKFYKAMEERAEEYQKAIARREV